MAIVLSLLIVGWLLAFALGSQAGFDAQADVKQAPAPSNSAESATAYSKPASVS